MTPIEAKTILLQAGVTQTQLARAIVAKDGRDRTVRGMANYLRTHLSGDHAVPGILALLLLAIQRHGVSILREDRT